MPAGGLRARRPAAHGEGGEPRLEDYGYAGAGGGVLDEARLSQCGRLNEKVAPLDGHLRQHPLSSRPVVCL